MSRLAGLPFFVVLYVMKNDLGFLRTMRFFAWSRSAFGGFIRENHHSPPNEEGSNILRKVRLCRAREEYENGEEYRKNCARSMICTRGMGYNVEYCSFYIFI